MKRGTPKRLVGTLAPPGGDSCGVGRDSVEPLNDRFVGTLAPPFFGVGFGKICAYRHSFVLSGCVIRDTRTSFDFVNECCEEDDPAGIRRIPADDPCRDGGTGMGGVGCPDHHGGRLCGSSVVWCGDDWSGSGIRRAPGGHRCAAGLEEHRVDPGDGHAAVVRGCDGGEPGFDAVELHGGAAQAQGRRL